MNILMGVKGVFTFNREWICEECQSTNKIKIRRLNCSNEGCSYKLANWYDSISKDRNFYYRHGFLTLPLIGFTLVLLLKWADFNLIYYGLLFFGFPILLFLNYFSSLIWKDDFKPPLDEKAINARDALLGFFCFILVVLLINLLVSFFASTLDLIKWNPWKYLWPLVKQV